MHHTKANLHIHSNFGDGIFSVKSILKGAKKRNFSIISITDHNEIKGSIKALSLAKKYNLIVIPGVEIYFRVGGGIYELLVYFKTKKDLTDFFNNFINTKSFVPYFKDVRELIKKIHDYDGVIITPHFIYKSIYKKELTNLVTAKDIEGIEIINAFNKEKNKLKLPKTFKNKKILKFGGCDLHVIMSSLNTAYTLLVSDNKITKTLFFENLSGKKRNIKFIPKGGHISLSKFYLQKFICTFSVPYYLAKQIGKYFYKKFVR